MLGAIIVVTLSHYIFACALDWGLSEADLTIQYLPLVLPPLLAGYFGAVQFVRTERKNLRLLARLIFAFKGCLAIVLAPFAASLILLIASSLTGGLALLQLIPSIAAFITTTAIMATLLFITYGLPTLFVGISLGFWTQRSLTRR